MAVTPEEAARALMERAERDERAIAARADDARARVVDAAALLRERYGVQQIILFGSLCWGGFHAGSDVDIAVCGLRPDDLGAAGDDATRIVGVRVELLRLEDLPPAFARRVLDEGRAL